MDKKILSKRIKILKKIDNVYDNNCPNCIIRRKNPMRKCTTSNCEVSLKLREFGKELDKLLPPRKRKGEKINA